MRFIESILWQQGAMPLLHFHQLRFEKTQLEAFGRVSLPSLSEMIQSQAAFPKDGQKYKCRIVYGETTFEISFTPYIPRKIQYLKLICVDDIDYHLKYEDRSCLNRLNSGRAPEGESLIVRMGLITDTSFTNVAFLDGRQWITPGEPLLEGVQRAYLLERGILVSGTIRSVDLRKFQKMKLFNALLDWHEAPVFSVAEDIIY